PIVARTLGIRRCFIPSDGGVLSAMGALLSDVTKDFAATKLRLLEEDRLDDIRQQLHDLLAQGDEWIEREGHDKTAARKLLSLDMRCRRQNYELNVPVPETLLSAAPQEFIKVMTGAFH